MTSLSARPPKPRWPSSPRSSKLPTRNSTPRTRAAELEDELEDVRAELLDARVAAEGAKIEDLGEKLVVLEATVAQQRDASVKLAAFEAMASSAVERAKAAEARADAADVVPAAEAEALKAEVAEARIAPRGQSREDGGDAADAGSGTVHRVQDPVERGPRRVQRRRGSG